MKITWPTFLRAYVVDYRKRRLAYCFAGLCLSVWLMETFNFKDNIFAWFYILASVSVMPIIFNIFIALYRLSRRHFLPANPVTKAR